MFKTQRNVMGLPSSPGVSIGEVVVIYPLAELDGIPDKKSSDIEEEISIFQTALQATRDEIHSLKKRMAHTLPAQEAVLFDAYLQLLDDNNLGAEVLMLIEQGQWAQGAIRQVIQSHMQHFAEMDNAVLKERAGDFEDLGRRLINFLQNKEKKQTHYPDKTILIGHEITANLLAEVPEGKLAGIVSSKGASNSHAAILARALGIPAVLGANNIDFSDIENKKCIVDGYYGQVFISPSNQLLKQYENLAQKEDELNQELLSLVDEPAITIDNHAIEIFANTGMPGDVSRALKIKSPGVGLYRTEVPFMSHTDFPDQPQQEAHYYQLLNAFKPRPVTMRTLDIGGDKMLSYFPIDEENPFLGWRGIRVTLDHPELFLTQIKAMLCANAETQNLKIMLPMVSSLDELTQGLDLIKQAHDEVTPLIPNLTRPKLGVMIEVPAAVYLTKQLAERVDFLSVGSNDLIQYILAVDRNNTRVANLFNAFHPAVLQALLQIKHGAEAAGKPVSICGEMASDPCAVILLLAMGYDCLSINPSSLLRVKWIVRQFKKSDADGLLNEVLVMDNPQHIRQHLESALDEAGLGGLIRAGK